MNRKEDRGSIGHVHKYTCVDNSPMRAYDRPISTPITGPTAEKDRWAITCAMRSKEFSITSCLTIPRSVINYSGCTRTQHEMQEQVGCTTAMHRSSKYALCSLVRSVHFWKIA